MRSVAAIGRFVLLLSAPPPPALAQSIPAAPKEDAALEREKAAILDVIERQAAAFWAKDFQRWARSRSPPFSHLP